MITLTNPTVDELQAVITAMCKVHPDLEVTGTLTIARAAGTIDASDPVATEVPVAVEVSAPRVEFHVESVTAKVVDPPRETPRRSDKPKRPVGRPPGGGRTNDDRLREACAKVDQDKPIGPQLMALLGVSNGSVFELHQRAIKNGWLRPSNRSSGLAPIERRPFDADAARMRAVGAI